MNPQILDSKDRVHILTDHYEWTILRGFANGRGPCYISDVRERARPNRQIIRDGGPGHTINDPQFGGLFGFGVVAAKPPDASPDPATFWAWGWEVTTRLADSVATPGFGVSDVVVHETGPTTIEASCCLRVLGQTVAWVSWSYLFGPGDQVLCTLAITPDPFPFPDLWIKEPKIVANGLCGYERLGVRNKAGNLLRGYDLTALDNPAKHTRQISQAARYSYTLGALGRPNLTIVNDGALTAWTTEADTLPPMSPGGPAYCLNAGKLWNRTEVSRWGTLDISGIQMHGWEGGAGAPDCWNCFRPWPTQPVTVRLGARVGPGEIVYPPAPPPPPAVPASWTLPGPLIFTASNPSAADGHAGVGTIGKIIDQTDAGPLWECFPVGGGPRGLCGQIEGDGQAQTCLDLIAKHRKPGDHLAIVGTGNSPAVTARLVAAGINVAFYELNAQAGWEPYGNADKMTFQGHSDGWPHVKPSYGCYDSVGLQDYRDYVPMVTNDGGKTWHRAAGPQGLVKDSACFSAEGMGDTNSWPALVSMR